MKNNIVRMSFTVPKGFKAVLKARAEAEGVSMSEFIRRATSEDQLRMLSLPTVG